MDELIEDVVQVVTCDGRVIVGRLVGSDQYLNLILKDCHERVFSEEEGVEQVVLGLYVIRGDNVVLVGEMNHEMDQSMDLSTLRAPPLTVVDHTAF